jgi:hypothetical protein
MNCGYVKLTGKLTSIISSGQTFEHDTSGCAAAIGGGGSSRGFGGNCRSVIIDTDGNTTLNGRGLAPKNADSSMLAGPGMCIGGGSVGS